MIYAPLYILLGILIGRVYGWMKYHNPEFKEEIKLRVAKLKAERAKWEAQEEFHRATIDDSLHERTIR